MLSYAKQGISSVPNSGAVRWLGTEKRCSVLMCVVKHSRGIAECGNELQRQSEELPRDETQRQSLVERRLFCKGSERHRDAMASNS